MCPDAWVDQYDLTQETVPQDLRKLLTVLENIEKCELSSNAAKPTVPNGNGTAKPNGTNDKNGKRKGMSSNADRIPKKVRTERHCVLCQKYGGRADSHNTSDCSKYEKDGTEKPGWVSKSPRTSPGKYKKPDYSYAQIQKKIEKLEKAVRKGKKGSSSRKKKRYSSSDSDSDSE